jgi:hypothetical protein
MYHQTSSGKALLEGVFLCHQFSIVKTPIDSRIIEFS